MAAPALALDIIHRDSLDNAFEESFVTKGKCEVIANAICGPGLLVEGLPHAFVALSAFDIQRRSLAALATTLP